MISTSDIKDNWCFECDEAGISLLRDVGDEVCASYSTVESKIMQYTGLKDANGVKIFEGDVVHHEWHDAEYHEGENWTGEIAWKGGGVWLQDFTGHYCGSKGFLDCVKVIGNIHQNPELLK